MRLGITIPQNEIGTDPGQIAAWAQDVEGLGFDYLDVFDHVLGADTRDRSDGPWPYGHEHHFHEPFVLYGFLAGKVELELAIGVLVLPQRQTALVAKQAAEVDLLSGGRLRLGVGIGWNAVEYEALGMDFGDRAVRYEEQIGLLRELWCTDVVDHRGVSHRIDRAGLAPLPIQRPIPVWMGGSAKFTVLDRIGRLADGWVVHAPHPAALPAALAEGRRSAESVGRDPGLIGVQGRIDVHGPLDADRFERALAGWAAAGADHVSIHATGQGDVTAHRALLPKLAALAARPVERKVPNGG